MRTTPLPPVKRVMGMRSFDWRSELRRCVEEKRWIDAAEAALVIEITEGNGTPANHEATREVILRRVPEIPKVALEEILQAPPKKAPVSPLTTRELREKLLELDPTGNAPVRLEHPAQAVCRARLVDGEVRLLTAHDVRRMESIPVVPPREGDTPLSAVQHA